MKKTVCIISAAVLMLFSFAGCGNDNMNNGDTKTTQKASSDMQDDVSKAADDVTKAVDDMAGDMSGADGMTDGTVTDDDGIIGNENTEDTKNDNNADKSDDNGNANASNPSDTLLLKSGGIIYDPTRFHTAFSRSCLNLLIIFFSSLEMYDCEIPSLSATCF